MLGHSVASSARTKRLLVRSTGMMLALAASAAYGPQARATSEATEAGTAAKPTKGQVVLRGGKLGFSAADLQHALEVRFPEKALPAIRVTILDDAAWLEVFDKQRYLRLGSARSKDAVRLIAIALFDLILPEAKLAHEEGSSKRLAPSSPRAPATGEERTTRAAAATAAPTSTQPEASIQSTAASTSRPEGPAAKPESQPGSGLSTRRLIASRSTRGAPSSADLRIWLNLAGSRGIGEDEAFGLHATVGLDRQLWRLRIGASLGYWHALTKTERFGASSLSMNAATARVYLGYRFRMLEVQTGAVLSGFVANGAETHLGLLGGLGARLRLNVSVAESLLGIVDLACDLFVNRFEIQALGQTALATPRAALSLALGVAWDIS